MCIRDRRGHQHPRGREGIHPDRIFYVWNVVTPMESELVLELVLLHLSKSTVRKT